MAAIDAALAALESLEPGQDFEYSAYAKKYGCSRTTLSRRHRKVQEARTTKLANGRLLNTVQEQQLVQYIKNLCARGLPPSRPMIRNFASDIAKKPVGKNWVDRFVKRHSIDLISHWATGLDRNRFKADNAFMYSLYFELIKQKIEQYNIDSRYIYNMDEKGFLIGILRLAWLKQVFDRETKAKARSSYRLLILDGHGSHVTMDFISYCDQNKILLAIYPPHSTHTLQPLDVVMFAPLAAAYKAELASFLNISQGLSSITKRDFYRLFNAAWTSSFTETLVIKAFAATGLHPFKPDVILCRFSTATPSNSRPSSSNSTTSAVDDVYDTKSKKLSQTIHTISVKNTLLQHENNQLKEALANEKKRRQRGKALLLLPPENSNGGAQFWSPTKVEQARQRQEQKDLEEQAAQYQKTETMKLREQQKLAKAQQLEERRLNRVVAKEKRDHEAEQKRLACKEDQMARQLKKQLQNDLKLSQKGKRRSLKLQVAVQSVEVDGEPAAGGVEELVVMATSRSGRQIKPTHKVIT
ncbi:Jerky protein [Pyrenophora tritici-repentis]|uniref:Jerky protein n=1 Tax=Pyrenophora tritici-repentis TaxID=45151 RepID=A0A922N212_9PLEO|nr:Jerky protein [Pyrenophora tritici-repentis]KAI1507951.1 Jerky protein [Pyrenophora tritici-repentis]